MAFNDQNQDQFIPWQDPRSDYGRPMSVPENQGLDVGDIFKTPASDAFMNLLQQFPQRTEPGRMRNILGLLGGLGAGVSAGPGGLDFRAGNPQEIMQAQDLIRYRPFYNQLQDWETKVQPLERAMQVERYSNANQRMLLNNLLQNQRGERRLDILEQRNAAQADLWEAQKQRYNEELELRRMQIAINDYKARNQAGPVKALEDGTLVHIQGNTATPIMVGGLPAKITSQAQLQQMIADRTIEGILTRAEQARINIGVAGVERERVGKSLIGARPTLTEAQVRVNIQRALIRHPEWRAYYDVNTKTFSNIPDSINPVELEQINDEIYGTPTVKPNVVPGPAPGSLGTVPPPVTKGTGRDIELPVAGKPRPLQQAKPSGRRMVIEIIGTGERGTIPYEDADRLDKTKYRIVGEAGVKR